MSERKGKNCEWQWYKNINELLITWMNRQHYTIVWIGHDKQCRASLFGYLASLRDIEVQLAAKEMFNNHVNGNQPLVAGKFHGFKS